MRRPLIILLIAFIAGIIAGSYFAFPCYLLLSLGVFILLFILISMRNNWLTVGFLLVVIFFLLLGIFNIQKYFYFIKDDRNILGYINQDKVIVEGIIIESPIVYPDKNILIVHCERILKNKSYIPTSGNIRLAIGPYLNFQYGDFIRFHSTIRKIHNFNNPGGFDYEYYLNLQGIHATCPITDSSGIMLLRHEAVSGIKLKLESFRNYLKQIIYKNASSPQREVIEAMTIGNQNEIPATVLDNFNKTGTSHILSISGLHIGMVSAVAFFFAFLILKSSEYLMLRFNIIKLAAMAAFLTVLIYAFIAGMGVTVMRSALMALIFLIALISGKQKDLYNTLALAGLIILCVSPEALFDISFQLSFMAVLALIYIVPRLSDIPSEKISALPLWMQGIIRYLYLSVIVCIAATIGTLPLIMYYFNRVSAVTIFANLIAVPLLGTITLAIAMFFILFSFFSPFIAGYFIKLASFFTQISIDIIGKMAAFEWSSIRVVKPDLIEIALIYIFIYLIFQFFGSKQNITAKSNLLPHAFIKHLLIIIAVFFIADITYLSFRDKLSSDLKITVIDVGQGNSILVRFPGGENMLVDGGGFSKSSFDTGKAVIAPFLYHERISHIDTVVLSHPHPDHLLGLIYIMNNFSVRRIWKSNLPVSAEEYPEWEKSIRINNIEVLPLSNRSTEKIFNGVHIKVLWPPDYSAEDIGNLSYDEVNDSSLVLKITYGRISFLFPADISSNIEEQLIKSGADLKSDVLVVPHHGSNHASSSDFIKAVSCHYAIASAGKSNTFKHPHPSVVQRYKDAAAEIFRTDRDGAISFTTDGDNLHIRTFMQSR
jgi:competence protein ComEC